MKLPTLLPSLTEPQTAAPRAQQICQRAIGKTGLLDASGGVDHFLIRGWSRSADEPQKVLEMADNMRKKKSPTSCDTGDTEKRAKGLEPSTFTLATTQDRPPSPISAQELPNSHDDQSSAFDSAQPAKLGVHKLDQALIRVLRIWPELPENLRDRILGMVEAAELASTDRIDPKPRRKS